MPATEFAYARKLDVLRECSPRRFEIDGPPITRVLTAQELFIHDVCYRSAVSVRGGGGEITPGVQEFADRTGDFEVSVAEAD